MLKAAVLDALRRLLSMPTFPVHPGLPALLATEGLAGGRPGFLDRLIHAEAVTGGRPLVAFRKAAGRLPNVRVLEGA